MYEDINDGLWPSDKISGNEGKQPLQHLLDILESQEVFVCPADPDPENFTWYYSNNLKKAGFIDNRCSFMVNEDALWFYHNRNSQAFKRALLSKHSEWLEMTDGNANLHSAARTW